jgi:hypothetical protein
VALPDGAGVGVAFVCMLKLASRWFHPNRFAMLAGCSLRAGSGAVSAGAPMRWLSDAFGWVRSARPASQPQCWRLPSGLVRDTRERHYQSYGSDAQTTPVRYTLLGGISESFRNRNVWLILLVSAGVSGAPLTFAGLWGVPFLTTHYGFTTAGAAAITSLVLVAWALPSPLLGTSPTACTGASRFTWPVP